jgi:hypothetical protein
LVLGSICVNRPTVTTSRSELEGQGTLEGMAFRNEVGERLKRLTEWSAFPRGRAFVTATGMSASLIGRVRSSAFRLSEPYDDIRPQSGDRIIMSWDIALSETETGDYSACVVLLKRGEVFYILEVVRGRFPFDALKRKVMEVKHAMVRPRF